MFLKHYDLCLCVIYCVLCAADSLFISCCVCQLSIKNAVHLNSHKDAFRVLTSFRVHSFKEALNNWSPQEHKSVLCVLGIEKKPESFLT